jgi:hypothetical protein
MFNIKVYMTMNTLNAEDVSKIIFLRDDRLPKGARTNAPSLRKIWHECSIEPWGERKGPMRWLESIVITRDKQVALEAQHPKALIKALYELRSLGYSATQVNAISTHVKDFMMDVVHGYSQSLEPSDGNSKALATGRHDGAFLGTASSDRGNDADYCAVFNNTAVLKDQETFYFKALVASLNRKITAQPDFLRLK